MHKKFHFQKYLLVMGMLIILLTSCLGGSAQPTSAPTAAVPAVEPTFTMEPTEVSGLPVLAEGTDGNPWWNDTVFYEIFVRSFYDSDGDGVGDFKGLTQKLDYLNDGNPETKEDLGIRGIWLMPIHPSPSYHGYDVTDYYAVNPDYGTLDDFKTFLQEAHKRGIRVVIDFVINHTSDQHPWFAASKDPSSDYRDWYIWTQEKPNYLGPWSQTVWHPYRDGWYYYGVFYSGMPDLNYENPDVTAEIQNVTRFWLDEMGVDGLRVDGARYLVEEGENQASTTRTHAWYEDFRSFYKGINPQAMTVGEVWTTSFEVAGYAKGDEFDLLFDFDLASAMMGGVGSGSAKQIQDSYTLDLRMFQPNQFATFLTNHDMNRAMTEFAGDVEKMKNAATIYLTGPGVPFIYYGEEIGMTGGKPDEFIRTPMLWSSDLQAGFTTGSAWGSVNMDFKKKNVAVQAGDPNSLLSWYRTLIDLREAHPALRIGAYGKVESESKHVFSMLRSYKDETILVIVNLGDEETGDYSLSGDLNLPDGEYTVESLAGEGEFVPLTLQGGKFSGYQPLEILASNARLVLRLVPNP